MDSFITDPKLILDMSGSHYYDLLREAHNARLAEAAGGTPAPWRSIFADWLYTMASTVDGQVQYRNQSATLVQ